MLMRITKIDSFGLTFIITGYRYQNNKLDKVCIYVTGFKNEIYVEVPKHKFNAETYESLADKLKQVYPPDNKLITLSSLYGNLQLDCFSYNSTYANWKLSKEIEIDFEHKFHHVDVNECLKFLISRNIKNSSWIEVNNYVTYRQHDFIKVYKCSVENINPVEENLELESLIIPLKILYFDIECESIDRNSVLEEENGIKQNIYQISVVLQINDDIRYILLSSHTVLDFKTEKDYPVVIINVKDERELIIKFLEIISEENPDIISGFNIVEFDWNQILLCVEEYNLDGYLSECSTSKIFKPKIIKTSWQSSAYSKKELYYPSFDGIVQLDVIQYMKRYHKLPSYSLENICKEFLPKRGKLDMNYKVIKYATILYKSLNNPEVISKILKEIKIYQNIPLIDKIIKSDNLLDTLKEIMTEIGKYCLVDSILCLELMDKFQIIITCEEMSKCTYVSMEDVLYRGNQLRVFNLIYKECKERKIICNKADGIFENDSNNKYEGALVLDPHVGLHTGVITLDFASLYPNIIINYNICYTTFLVDKKPKEKFIEIKSGNETYKFSTERPGILPLMCSNLIKERGMIRNKLKLLEEGTLLKRVLDSKQLAYKIIANSIYGILGTGSKGYRPLEAAAKSITSIGREMLMKVKKTAEIKNLKVIYGDTDSNMIVLPSSDTKPYRFYDIRTFSNHIIYNFKDEGEVFFDGEYIWVNEDKHDIFVKFMKENYDIDVYEERINIPKLLKSLADNLGFKLSSELTEIVNNYTKNKTNFVLEYENCFEQLILFGKKYYAGRKYDGKISKKGVLSVKTGYAKIEKDIYNNILNIMFTHNLMEKEKVLNKIFDLYKTFFYKETDDMYKYVVTTLFKTFGDHARKIGGLYVDSEGGKFRTNKKYDPRFIFDVLPVHVSVALDMVKKNEDIHENERIEYVFIKSKGNLRREKAINYGEFFNKKNLFRLDPLVYIERLSKQTLNTLTTVGFTCSSEFKKYHVIKHIYNLSSGFTPKHPVDLNVHKYYNVTVTRGENETVYSLEVKNTVFNDKKLEDLDEPHIFRNSIKEQLGATYKGDIKVSVNILSPALTRMETLFYINYVKPLLNTTKKNKFQWYQCNGEWEKRNICLHSLLQSYNSFHVLQKIYKKYKIRKSVKTETIINKLVDSFEKKENLIREISGENNDNYYFTPEYLRLTRLKNLKKPPEKNNGKPAPKIT